MNNCNLGVGNRSIAAALILVLFSMASACQKERKTPFVEVDEENLPTHYTEDFSVVIQDSLAVRAIVSADKASVFEDRKKTYLNDSVQVEFLHKLSQQRVSLLTADSAEIDDKTHDMTARGHVVVISDSTATTLTTSLLMWDEKKRKLYSTEFVRIESPTEIIEGYGFESDQYLKNYTIFKVSGSTYK